MLKFLNNSIKESVITKLEWTLIIIVAIVPVFFTLPYRDNIYLSWEGAYRLYLGQVPFRDFGLPMGYGYWIIPALFFKIFGPYLHSLIKAQVLINIVSGLAFRSVLKSLHVEPGTRLLSVFLYVISFSFLNFWPWYNHTVIVYEFIGIAFLLASFQKEQWKSYLYVFISTFFLFLSFFTKQDGGAFAVMSGLLLVGYYSFLHKDIRIILSFCISLGLVTLIFILPLLPHDFSYWFNYGQPPHNSRVNLADISHEVFGASEFLKLYVLLVAVVSFNKLKSLKKFLSNEKQTLFFLTTSLILFQAFILQVTSYIPREANIYFHSFAFAYIISNLPFKIDFTKLKYIGISAILIFFWWSGAYWKYTNRMLKAVLPVQEVDNTNKVGIKSFTINRDTTAIDISKWIPGQWKEFRKIKMPKSAIESITKLQNHALFNTERKPKVLNMSEYTPLASLLGYELETNQPLWYHLNVAMFERELLFFEEKINKGYYDIVLFEVIPDLNNFYPFKIREVLQEKYQLIDQFQAPRDKKYELVEVYLKRGT
ncbi:MAG: hypothetical protein AAGI07_10540 [Bacteroidota bacterium]